MDARKEAGTVWEVLKATVQKWNRDEARRLAASLAFYALVSLAPLLVIVVSIVGLVYSEQAATGQLAGQMEEYVGHDAALTLQRLIRSTDRPAAGLFATLIGTLVLLFGASRVFVELEKGLNDIWGVRPKSAHGVWSTVKNRGFGMFMVLAAGVLLLASIIASTVLSAVAEFFVDRLPFSGMLAGFFNAVISVAILTAILALVFKYVPNADIAWRDVGIGACATAMLFTAGNLLVGLYLGRGSFTSIYGAAASLFVILLWLYYTAQILFLGAEFTQVYANTYGSRLRREGGAKPAT
ncbi:YihY/virulence factor BrkB family protein [Methylomagnum sp.]